MQRKGTAVSSADHHRLTPRHLPCPLRPRVSIVMMYATRTCSRAPLSALRSCRPSSSCNLAARHLERTLFVSPTRYPPRLPTPTFDPVSFPSSRRNLSISPTPPRRAQYSRFDDDPNYPPPHSAGTQRRDIIIYTLAAGSVIYYFVQCVIYVLHLISHALIPPLLLFRFSKVSNKSQRPVGGGLWM